MTALVVTVLIASLAGSLHCAGMCGAFAAISAFPDPARPASRWIGQCAYHAGRLIVYIVFGLAAGALGAALDLSGALFGLQRAALILAGGAMVVFGGIALAQSLGIRTGRAPVPRFMQRAAVRAHTWALRKPPAVRGLVVGLCTTFLPCGWLYAFVLVAAGTGAPLLGAVVMSAFWVGTVPILAGVGTAVQIVTGRFRRFVPACASIAIIIAGVIALMDRMPVPALRAAGASVRSAEELSRAVEAIDQETLPCCKGQ